MGVHRFRLVYGLVFLLMGASFLLRSLLSGPPEALDLGQALVDFLPETSEEPLAPREDLLLAWRGQIGWGLLWGLQLVPLLCGTALKKQPRLAAVLTGLGTSVVVLLVVAMTPSKLVSGGGKFAGLATALESGIGATAMLGGLVAGALAGSLMFFLGKRWPERGTVLSAAWVATAMGLIGAPLLLSQPSSWPALSWWLTDAKTFPVALPVLAALWCGLLCLWKPPGDVASVTLPTLVIPAGFFVLVATRFAGPSWPLVAFVLSLLLTSSLPLEMLKAMRAPTAHGLDPLRPGQYGPFQVVAPNVFWFAQRGNPEPVMRQQTMSLALLLLAIVLCWQRTTLLDFLCVIIVLSSLSAAAQALWKRFLEVNLSLGKVNLYARGRCDPHSLQELVLKGAYLLLEGRKLRLEGPLRETLFEDQHTPTESLSEHCRAFSLLTGLPLANSSQVSPES